MNSATTLTEQKLQAIVARKLKIGPERVPLNQSLLEGLGLDSIDAMAVILEIEREFAPVTFSERAAEELKTLRDVASYIDLQMGAR
jgi:acyl carrier protein